MATFGLSRQQFEARYAEVLEVLEPQAIERLRHLLERPVPPEVTGAQIEIFMEEYGGSPSAWMYFDGKNRRASGTDPSIFPGRALDLDLAFEALANIQGQWYTAEFGGLDVAASLTKRWLARCWELAGGRGYPVRVTLSVHDGWGGGVPQLLTDRQ